MAHIITVYSKYVIVLFLYLFLGASFLAHFKNSTKKQKKYALFQAIFLFCMQFAAYLTIVIRTQRAEYLIFYLFLQILTMLLPEMAAYIYPGMSRVLLNQMSLLLAVGMILMTRLDMDKAVRQLLIAAAAFVISLFIPAIMKSFRFLSKLGWIYVAVGIAALSAVLILGQVTHGSKISYTIAGITFQPSELIKITYVFFLAAFLGKSARFGQIFLSGVLAAIHVLVLVFSRDLGSALIYFVTYVLLITIASHKFIYLPLGAAGCAGACAVAYKFFSHVQVRVQAWKDPWSVIDDQGYQITQSLFAMSRGGLFGLGIGKGTPQDIPFVETDFIFAAMTEEMGILFSAGVIGVSILCFLNMVKLAGGLTDGFYKFLAAGFAMLYLFQIFLTVGGGTKFIPLTGVTLPFISYGGSSVMTSIFMFAVIQGIYTLRYREEERIARQRKKAKEGVSPEEMEG